MFLLENIFLQHVVYQKHNNYVTMCNKNMLCTKTCSGTYKNCLFRDDSNVYAHVFMEKCWEKNYPLSIIKYLPYLVYCTLLYFSSVLTL